MGVFSIGMRNILRSRRRSILNIIALALGFVIMTVGLAWVAGYDTHVFGALRSFDTGDAQVTHAGYMDEAARFPLDMLVFRQAELATSLAALPEIQTATPRIVFVASLSKGETELRLVARAIDPEGEAAVTVVEDQVAAGRYFRGTESNGPELLISEQNASALEVEVGDTVWLSAVDSYGVRNRAAALLVGLFTFGYPPVDENLVFADYASAAEFLGVEGSATHLVLAGASGVDPSAVAAAAARYLSGRPATADEGTAGAASAGATRELEAHPWRTFVEAAATAIETDVFFFYLTLAVLFFLVIVGIINSMSMSILERSAEIGTLRALGFRRGLVIRLLLTEGIGLAVVATVAGAVLATPMLLYLTQVGLDVASAVPESIPVPFGETFTAVFTVGDALLAVTVTLGAAAVGTALPALRVSREGIVESMRGHKR